MYDFRAPLRLPCVSFAVYVHLASLFLTALLNHTSVVSILAKSATETINPTLFRYLRVKSRVPRAAERGVVCMTKYFRCPAPVFPRLWRSKKTWQRAKEEASDDSWVEESSFVTLSVEWF